MRRDQPLFEQGIKLGEASLLGLTEMFSLEILVRLCDYIAEVVLTQFLVLQCQ